MQKIDYATLNARQQENYNAAKLAAVLADYGLNRPGYRGGPLV